MYLKIIILISFVEVFISFIIDMFSKTKTKLDLLYNFIFHNFLLFLNKERSFQCTYLDLLKFLVESSFFYSVKKYLWQ